MQTQQEVGGSDLVGVSVGPDLHASPRLACVAPLARGIRVEGGW